MSQKKNNKNPAGNDPHRKREQSKYAAPIASREFITDVLASDKGPMDIEALAGELGLTGNPDGEEALRRRVGAMIRDGQLIQNRKRGLVPVDTDALIAGRISAHPDGFGFVIADDGDKDIYLNGKQMRLVLHGDRVVVCITGTDHRGRREGRIVDVVERANKSLVGRLSIDRGTVVVLPDNKRIHQDLLIAPGSLADAADGDMVVAEIIEQPTRKHQPVGKIVEVLGQHLKAGMEIDVALHSHGIPVDWPDAVTDQAASFSTIVDSSNINGRKDVRDLPLVTIDGIDARDFDDAVWCEPLESGWRLMVAIADVAHYVSVDSALDKEAVDRGTSVYFPGRVVPMLPEVLSNGLCSLNPEVDRLCMICEMTLDDQANVKKTQFHNGIMRSHARLTYDQVGEMLSDEQSDLRDEYAPLMPVIDELYRLYKALAAKRRERGAIEFDSNETHIIFDDNKKIKEIIPIQRNDAHKLIEECMILANIEAAAFLEAQEIPALYRVHAGPKSDRLIDLRAFLALRGLTLGGGDLPSAIDYAALAEQISERTDRSVIQTVMLRSMQQAVYQPKNEGHFGLALDQYAHFTSPIRRYPDLLVHRAIKHALLRGKPADYRYSKEAMQVLGESCSMTERRAEEASRDVVSWLKCEYMQEHVGSEFEGVISAVTSFGLFVELVGIHVEGLVHITNLSRDYYRFEQAAHALTGERTGKQYHLGDAIVVKVAAVNLEERKIDFSEVAEQGQQAQAPAKEKRRGKKSHKNSKQHTPVVNQQPADQNEVAAGPAADPQKKSESARAEKRRQDKRRQKQKRRDAKRAERKEASRLEALRVASQSPGGVDASSEPASNPANVPAADNSGGEPVRTGKSKSAKRRQKRRDAQKVAAMAQSQDATAVTAVATDKAAKPVTAKPKSKVTAKVASKVASKKATAKVAAKPKSKVTAKVASKVASKKATAKVAAKPKSKVTAKVASKVASKKATAKVAAKPKSKVTAKVASKVASKKATAKVAAKPKSKVTAKVASKVASKKATAKVAAKPKSKVTAKVASKVASKKASAKVAAKPKSKVTAKIASKAANKAKAKVIAKPKSNVAAKAAGKAKAKPKAAAKPASKTAGKAKAKTTAKPKSKATAKFANKAAGKAKATAKPAGKVVKKATSKTQTKAKSKVASKKPAGKAIAKKAVGKATGKAVAKSKSKAKSKAKSKS